MANCEVFVFPAASSLWAATPPRGSGAFLRLGKNALIADIGTNGELVLAHGGRLLCVAAAAGRPRGARPGHAMTVGAVSAVYCETAIGLNTGGGKGYAAGAGRRSRPLDCGARFSGRLRGNRSDKKEGRLRSEFGGVYIDDDVTPHSSRKPCRRYGNAVWAAAFRQARLSAFIAGGLLTGRAGGEDWALPKSWRQGDGGGQRCGQGARLALCRKRRKPPKSG